MVVADHGLDDGKTERLDVGLRCAVDGCDNLRLAVESCAFRQMFGKAFVVDLMPLVAVAPFAGGLAAIHECSARRQLRARTAVIYIW